MTRFTGNYQLHRIMLFKTANVYVRIQRRKHKGLFVTFGVCIVIALSMIHIRRPSPSGALFTIDTIQRELQNEPTITGSSITFQRQDINHHYHDESNIQKVEEGAYVVDIISVGSITKAEFQDAQERTFRTHPTVRNYYRINEWNDTDASCHTDLTTSQFTQIKSYCKKRHTQQSGFSKAIRRLLYNPKNHTGWMCAQKRPIDGLFLVLQQYKHQQHRIPNYLLIIDDDSYFYMDAIIEALQQNHTNGNDVPNLITGCPYNYPQSEHFVFPYGGFSSFISKKAIQNLLKPINCNNLPNNADGTTIGTDSTSVDHIQDGFNEAACYRLQENTIGELPYFKNGMSVADLMYEYSSQLAFTKVSTWENGTGFCFHSDHALGYFFGFYHIAVPDSEYNNNNDETIDYEELRRSYGYIGLAGPKECRNVRKRCTTESRICHYIRPYEMDYLFDKQQKSQ